MKCDRDDLEEFAQFAGTHFVNWYGELYTLSPLKDLTDEELDSFVKHIVKEWEEFKKHKRSRLNLI